MSVDKEYLARCANRIRFGDITRCWWRECSACTVKFLVYDEGQTDLCSGCLLATEFDPDDQRLIDVFRALDRIAKKRTIATLVRREHPELSHLDDETLRRLT